jgi:hypothetical protein
MLFSFGLVRAKYPCDGNPPSQVIRSRKLSKKRNTVLLNGLYDVLVVIHIARYLEDDVFNTSSAKPHRANGDD